MCIYCSILQHHEALTLNFWEIAVHIEELSKQIMFVVSNCYLGKDEHKLQLAENQGTVQRNSFPHHRHNLLEGLEEFVPGMVHPVLWPFALLHQSKEEISDSPLYTWGKQTYLKRKCYN